MQPHPLAQRIRPQLIRWRQALHRIPEEGDHEHATQAYLLRQLTAMRPDVLTSIGGTGLKCVFEARGAKRALAFRADMDALPIAEETGLPFASEHPGWMHACGHDGHMTALLGLAACCAALRAADKLPCHVVLLFQPAEETTGGAQKLIEQGALDDPYVSEVFGLHLMPDVPLGRYACCEGAMMASDYEFDIELLGRSAHGAMPQHGVNAMDAAAALYTQLKAIPLSIAPGELALLNVGTVKGGDGRNIVPALARMECVARTYTAETLELIKEKTQRAIAGIARAHEVVITQTDIVYYPPVINPRHLVQALARRLGGEMITQTPLLIAEDFSFYQRARPALFIFVGTGSEGCRHPLHSSHFTYEDEALLYALSAHLMMLFDRANES